MIFPLFFSAVFTAALLPLLLPQMNESRAETAAVNSCKTVISDRLVDKNCDCARLIVSTLRYAYTGIVQNR